MHDTSLSFRRTAMSLFAMGALAASPPLTARADPVTPPAVPGDIEVQPGNEPFLVGHAVGTQNYVCVRSGGDFKFVLFTPQATLFKDDGGQLTTHFFGPNPVENGTIRAAWQHSRDTSTFWGKATGFSTDPAFVAEGAIPWVRLERAGVAEGPTGGATLAETTFVQRVNTFGGAAPATGCSSMSDIGNQRFVPYTADYVFYRRAP